MRSQMHTEMRISIFMICPCWPVTVQDGHWNSLSKKGWVASKARLHPRRQSTWVSFVIRWWISLESCRMNGLVRRHFLLLIRIWHLLSRWTTWVIRKLRNVLNLSFMAWIHQAVGEHRHRFPISHWTGRFRMILQSFLRSLAAKIWISNTKTAKKKWTWSIRLLLRRWSREMPMDVGSSIQSRHILSQKSSTGPIQRTIVCCLRWLPNMELHIFQIISTVIWNQVIFEACAAVCVWIFVNCVRRVADSSDPVKVPVR